jgi:hypothetical protein
MFFSKDHFRVYQFCSENILIGQHELPCTTGIWNTVCNPIVNLTLIKMDGWKLRRMIIKDSGQKYRNSCIEWRMNKNHCLQKSQIYSCKTLKVKEMNEMKNNFIQRRKGLKYFTCASNAIFKTPEWIWKLSNTLPSFGP